MTVEILSFYRRSDFTWNPILMISNSQKIIFGNFTDSELWIMVNFDLEVAQIYKNQNSEPLKMPKMHFKFSKIWFFVKSEWQANCKISTLCCLNFTFWKFLEHSDCFRQKIFSSTLKITFPELENIWRHWSYLKAFWIIVQTLKFLNK